jgi:hypothetical protein
MSPESSSRAVLLLFGAAPSNSARSSRSGTVTDPSSRRPSGLSEDMELLGREVLFIVSIARFRDPIGAR